MIQFSDQHAAQVRPETRVVHVSASAELEQRALLAGQAALHVSSTTPAGRQLQQAPVPQAALRAQTRSPNNGNNHSEYTVRRLNNETNFNLNKETIIMIKIYFNRPYNNSSFLHFFIFSLLHFFISLLNYRTMYITMYNDDF